VRDRVRNVEERPAQNEGMEERKKERRSKRIAELKEH